ncbi:MAG TPA: polynucleotide adenylyltransferase PcnB [Nevskiaceae bacterium]|nr:polynucleotide adenylyltransferase PcnB [Nevskiaceae bacterium]
MQGRSLIEPQRIPRAEHNISRQDISPGALKVLYTLRDAGYEAYMVGGGVRDLLAGIKPKDFDIATSAHPEQIKQLFGRSCQLIGRRFIICHVRVGPEVSEVTTFRGPITESHERDETGRILSDNMYGTLEQDAFRRDFTINALYYDIRDYAVVDFAGGMADLQARSVRLIGDPDLRYREDPVRMLRAVRIASKLGFTIEAATAAPIPLLAPLLAEIPPARLFDEVIKVLQSAEAVANYEGLAELGLFAQLFPETDALAEHDDVVDDFIALALANTQARVRAAQTVSPAFLYAALLWPPVRRRMQHLTDHEAHHVNAAIAQAGEEVLGRAVMRVAIPKRFSLPMREIWQLQPRFEQRQGGRARRLLAHPRFRAAYDFLLLRARCGEVPQELADWWTQAQKDTAHLPPATENEADEGADALPAGEGAASGNNGAAPGNGNGPRKRRRRRGGRGRRGGPPAAG